MPSEERLIDANALLATETFSVSNGICRECENEYRLEVMNAPTVDAVKVVHGRWMPCGFGKEIMCSVCGCELNDIWQYRYCPDCGAKMDLENE